jgi:hypothetical protein
MNKLKVKQLQHEQNVQLANFHALRVIAPV